MGWGGEGWCFGRGVVVVVMAEVALLLVLPRGFATEICVVIVDGGGERVALGGKRRRIRYALLG